MSRYTLRQLEYLVAVGETGSIARAAERLHVSSPSISSAITQLEEAFGIPLFVRQHAQGLSLTQGGRRVHDQARRVLAEAAALGDIASDVAGRAEGPLAVGCLVTFAQLVLPRLRCDFEAAYPSVRIRQSELNQAELFDAIRRSDIDIALTYDLDIPADLRFTGLVRLRPFAVLPAAHKLADRAEIALEELVDLPMVLLDLPISTDYFLSLFAASSHMPRIAERTRDMAVMRSLVGNGFGFSIVNVKPQSDIAPDGGHLVCVPIAGKVRSLRMGLLVAQGAEKSRNVRAFMEFARDQMVRGGFEGIGGEPVT
ncbi:MAG: LysR family transcriptional regulator [Pseudomonadota bacterium]